MPKGKNKQDWLAIISRGAFGAIPFAGPIAAEIVGEMIPNQRMDRILSLLKSLEKKIADLEQELVARRMREKGFVDLFEDGMQQASRALNQERIEHIASILRNGLEDDDSESIRYKKIMYILGELSDPEVLLLQAIALPSEEARSFIESHPGHPTHMHASFGPEQKEIDADTLRQSFTDHLVRMGLLKPIFKNPGPGKPAEIDLSTGVAKVVGHRVSPLGQLLLRTVGELADGNE